jgi:DNA-binding response OmpR family regulator
VARILLIEDFAVIRRLIEVAIDPLHHHMTQVATGEQAMDLLETEDFDLILLDIGLPGIDGWEVLERMRASSKTASVPVLVVTAHGDQADEDLAFRLGANGFIAKPFRPDLLMSEVERLLAG